MRVTIAINNYNYAPYLKDAIDSALNQSYKNTEVIVVDDGSTDHSKEIIMSYGDKVRSFFQKNHGQVSAINKGWKEAKGEVIFFLDADDVLKPNAVEKCINKYQENDYINVYYTMERVDAELVPTGGVTPDQGYSSAPPIEDMKKWGYYACPPTSAQSFKKTFLDQVMPLAERKKGELDDALPADAYLSTCAPFMGKTFFIQESLAYYRLHGNNKGSLRNRFSKEKLRRMWMRSTRSGQIQMELAKKYGIDLKEDRISYYPLIVQYRFLSFRLFPEGHPIESDTYFYLLKRSLTSVFIYPYFSLTKRLKYFIIMLAIGLLPREAIWKVLNLYTKTKR